MLRFAPQGQLPQFASALTVQAHITLQQYTVLQRAVYDGACCEMLVVCACGFLKRGTNCRRLICLLKLVLIVWYGVGGGCTYICRYAAQYTHVKASAVCCRFSALQLSWQHVLFLALWCG